MTKLSYSKYSMNDFGMSNIHVKKRNGRLEILNVDKINKVADRACRNLDCVSASELALDAKLQFFDKITTTEIDQALILTASSKIEKDPNYSYVAARLQLNCLYKEVFGEGVDADTFELLYKKSFISNIKKLIKDNRLDSRLLEFNLKKLSAALDWERDDLFKYLGVKTIYDRYLIKSEERRMETPQAFWMRVAMGLALNEQDKDDKAIEFYNTLSQFHGCSSTPTLFNSGTTHSQLSSCYLNTFDDSVDGIFDGLWQEARKSKYAGGLGFDVTPFRATGSYISGTNGASSGLIPWLKIYNDMLIAVNQCFLPDTRILTSNGIKNINSVNILDHVIAEDGTWRAIKECLKYPYVGKILNIKLKYGITNLRVTHAHPILAWKTKTKECSYARIKNKIKLAWIESGNLEKGDFVAQAIPQFVSKTFNLTKDDLRFYGLMLGDGHFSIRETKQEAGISLNIETDKEVISFVRAYLDSRDIHTWDSLDNICLQIRFTPNKLWLKYDDLYDIHAIKRIHPKYYELTEELRISLIRGLIESDGGIYRNNEIHLYNSSLELIEGCSFLLLCSGIPSSASYAERTTTHLTNKPFITNIWDLRIPSYGIVADELNTIEIKKLNWIKHNNYLLSKIKNIEEEYYTGDIHDFKIKEVHSYSPVGIVAHNGGRRPGSGCAYLEPWHLDVEEFIELRKPIGEERRRTHDMNTALWICDLFMERVEQDGDWYLFCPSEAGHLHELYGKTFNTAYLELCEKAAAGEIKMFKVIKAKELWKKTLKSIFETSHPWITFKDPSNLRYSNKHEGVVHSSNLCCVAGDQLIPTEFGFKTAKELSFLNLDYLTVVGRTAFEQATGLQKTLSNSELLKINTYAGYSHRVTKDHPVWVKDKGWVEAQNLIQGDLIETQQIEGLWGKENFTTEAFLMGLIAGDGTFANSSVCIDLWGEDEEFIPRIEKCVNYVLRKYNVKLNTNATLTPKFKECNTGTSNIKKWRLSSGPLKTILRENFNFYKENKTDFPSCLYPANKATISKYIEGRFIADGAIQLTKEMTVSSLCSTNLEFLKLLQIILSNFGVCSFINKAADAGERRLPDGYGGYKNYLCEATYRILITNKKDNIILDKNCYIFKNRGLKITNKKLIYNVKNYVEVSTIIPDGVEDTFCLKVLSNEEHAWTCNGLITKNTEIMLHTKPSKYKNGEKTEVGETAVCNLASVNLSRMTKIIDGKHTIDHDKLKDTVKILIRMLDNVIDINFYPTPEAKNSNMRHRPIGLGIMGFHDLCHLLDIQYDTDAGANLADTIHYIISWTAIKTSADLAKEKGKYYTYEGSEWSKGNFPIKTWYDSQIERGHGFEVNPENPYKDSDKRNNTDTHYTKHYYEIAGINMDEIVAYVKEHGMRNSNVMAIAPTATISYIQGCEQSIEPNFSVLFVYENKSGNSYVINEHFVNDMKKIGLWNVAFAEAVKAVDGDVMLLDIPDKYKQKYKTAFDRDMIKLIEAAGARQKWIDMGQSFNIYNAQKSLKYMNDIAFAAWRNGLKTTYYWRNRAASKVEKSTVNNLSPINIVKQETTEATCSLEARRLGLVCESCQ